MLTEIEKGKTKAVAGPATNPEVRRAHEVNAKMHFYSVHNAGEQLRCAVRVRTVEKPDRMVGR